MDPGFLVEIAMTMWIILAFAVGSISGFGLFAALQMGRDASEPGALRWAWPRGLRGFACRVGAR
jgi:hypothetical protein